MVYLTPETTSGVLIMAKKGGLRVQHVGVKLTSQENEALREAAFRERTTKSSLLRSLFLRYLRKQESESRSH
jgi:hypothetical protein